MTDYLIHPNPNVYEPAQDEWAVPAATPDEWSPQPATPEQWSPQPATPEQWSPPPATQNSWEPQQESEWMSPAAPQAQWGPPSAPQAQWGPPAPPQPGPVFVYDRAPRRSRKTFLIVAALAVAAGAVAAAIVATRSNAAVGFNDPAKLADDVSATINARAIDRNLDFSVTSVDCIKNQGREFVCHVEYSDGDAGTLSVTVSQDGQTWISHSQ